MGEDDLCRLRFLRELLGDRGLVEPTRCRLACFTTAGFSAGLRELAEAGEVVLVDLERLYRGD